MVQAAVFVELPLLPHQRLSQISKPTIEARSRARCLSIALIIEGCFVLGLSLVSGIIPFVLDLDLWAAAGVAGLALAPSLASFIVLAGAAGILHNTSQYIDRDVCCNLLRTYPTYCTTFCGTPHRCVCARASCSASIVAILAAALALGPSVNCALLAQVMTLSLADQGSHGISDNSSGEMGLWILFGAQLTSTLVTAAMSGTAAATACSLRRLESQLPTLVVLPEDQIISVTSTHSDSDAAPDFVILAGKEARQTV